MNNNFFYYFVILRIGGLKQIPTSGFANFSQSIRKKPYTARWNAQLEGEVIISAEISVYEKELIREIEETPHEYLPNLLQIVRLFRESMLLKPAEDGFRQGWKETISGETRPVSELWDEIVVE